MKLFEGRISISSPLVLQSSPFASLELELLLTPVKRSSAMPRYVAVVDFDLAHMQRARSRSPFNTNTRRVELSLRSRSSDAQCAEPMLAISKARARDCDSLILCSSALAS